jgi:hypothetical protein
MVVTAADLMHLPAFISQKPILLLDADEVLLRFVEHLGEFLTSEGYELRLTSFQLAGNIFDLDTGLTVEPLEVRSLIASFFDNCAHNVPAVEGAAAALEELSELYQIAVLSNVPAHCRERRAQNLADAGMNYPVIANKGDKGATARRLADLTDKTTVFVDDLPPQHTSVKEHAPHIHRVHFVADPRLAKLIGKAPDADIRIDEWPILTKHLLQQV